MASWLTGSHCALPLHCSKRAEPENAQQSIIFGAFVRHPSDLQTCRIARVCHCVFYYEFWRRFQQTGVPRKLGKGGGACSSETMETKLGHCTNFVLFFFFFFFDLVKAGVCINVPTFPYQRCFETLLSCGLIIYFIAVLWLASSPGPALAEIPSTTCWQPGRDASPTRSEEGQSSQASIASIFLSLHSPWTWLSASPEQSLSVVFTPGLSTSQCALAVETWGGRQSSRKLRCMDLILAWSSTWTTNQPVCFSSISYTPPTSPSHGHNLFLSFP